MLALSEDILGFLVCIGIHLGLCGFYKFSLLSIFSTYVPVSKSVYIYIYIWRTKI